MKTTTVIATTTKGARVFLESLNTVGWPAGTQYTVTIGTDTIAITRATEDTTGKIRKVVASKGGVIDLESKKVRTWAAGSTSARVLYRGDIIVIIRESK